MSKQTTSEKIRFPIIPLASGNAATSANGTIIDVTAVVVTIHLANGEKIEVPLADNFGGWWVPNDYLGPI